VLTLQLALNLLNKHLNKKRVGLDYFYCSVLCSGFGWERRSADIENASNVNVLNMQSRTANKGSRTVALFLRKRRTTFYHL
jgi:hypothetical protein